MIADQRERIRGRRMLSNSTKGLDMARCRPLIVSAVLLVLAVTWVRATAEESPGARSAATPAERLACAVPRAKVGDEIITVKEIEQVLGAPLAQLEQQRQSLLSQKLDQLIGERLLMQEANNRGLTVQHLLAAEVAGKVPEATDAEVTGFIAQNRARLPGGDEAELRSKVRDHVRVQKVHQRQRAFISALRGQAAVSVDEAELRTVRVSAISGRGLARGPANAPVEIVMFADFECPFSGTVLPALRQLLASYPDGLRLVFRDFPTTIDPLGAKAHLAARCAAAQAMFWEYHDLLYERPHAHAAADLKRYGQLLGLDPSAFAQCLDGGHHQATVDADIEEGLRLGVSAAPTSFVNGRMLVGAQSFADFRRLVENELAGRASR